MHQPIEDEAQEPELSEYDQLLSEKYRSIGLYRSMVRWACNALDYKRRFEREEDFGEDDLADSIKFLQDDSRRELRSVATDIKIVRKRIDKLDEQLMNLAKENTDD